MVCKIICRIFCIVYIIPHSDLYNQSCPPTQHAQAFTVAAKLKPMLLPVAFCLALVCQSLFSSDVHVHDHLSSCMCNDIVVGSL